MAEPVDEIVDLTLHSKPAGETHWCCRTMAAATGSIVVAGATDLVGRGPETAPGGGIFRSVPDLIDAIEDYLSAHNDQPRPLVWTASTESILEKVARGRVTLKQVTTTRTHH